MEGQGPKFFTQACKLRLEGIVSKRAVAPYLSRRTEDWLKVKCLNRQEFVIGGWMRSEKPGRELRSRLLGYYQGGKLVFAGKAGTGFGLAAGHELRARGSLSAELVAAVGNARTFSRGRDLAAWLGLVPRQATTGGKPRLLGISKRGNRYLRNATDPRRAHGSAEPRPADMSPSTHRLTEPHDAG